MPLVSIIIPAYNAGRFIGRALNGVLAQTHTEWEIIVVEDGSHDDTQAIIERFAASVPQKVSYENSGYNLGVSATRNRAMTHVRGDVIAFLDADDWWMPEHLSAGLQTLEKGADICYSGFHIYDESTQKVIESAIPSLPENPLASLFKSNFIQTSSLVMLSRRAAEMGGGFDVNLKVGEDCDYWMSILSHGLVMACTGQQTCYYTKHGTSAMAKTLMVAEYAVKFHFKHLKSEFLPISLRKEGYAECLWIYGRLLQRQDPRRAVALFFEAWRCCPFALRYMAYAVRACVLVAMNRTSAV